MTTERTLTNREEALAEKLQERPAVTPFVDIYENADEILVVADVPGVTTDGLTVNFEKGELTFEARRSDAADLGPGAGDAGLPDYRRAFMVPRGIDAEKIAADLKDGLLRIHLPKGASLKPRQISIKAS
jgi:HSP20 family molecular chaperone IbpA